MRTNDFGDSFLTSVAAAETLIRVNTDEPNDALEVLSNICRGQGWELRVFDMVAGVRWLAGEPRDRKTAGKSDPLSPLENAASAYQVAYNFWREPALLDTEQVGETRPAILVLRNCHLVIDSNRERISALLQNFVTTTIAELPGYEKDKAKYAAHNLDESSSPGKYIVGLMPPTYQLPPEISSLFRLLLHSRPDENELVKLLDNVLSTMSSGSEDSDEIAGVGLAERKLIAQAALGLTRAQASGAFAACLVNGRAITQQEVWRQKELTINSEGLVEISKGTVKFDDIAGLEGAKHVLTKLLTRRKYETPESRPRGAVFCGPPGVGKSLIAKAAGNEFGLPTLVINPGNWMGGHVGDTEAMTRRALEIIRLNAPCIAFIDEAEKVMPSSKGPKGDSGVSARMEGTLLTAMNDMQERVFWVFTANNIELVHEALFRAERVDAVFYVKLPGPAQRVRLWQMYGKMFFPAEINERGRTFENPSYRPIAFGEVITELQNAIQSKKWKPGEEKGSARVLNFARRFELPLMCLEDRQAAMEQIQGLSTEVANNITLVDDDGWSPAEIRACCRQSLLMTEPVSETQYRIRPVAVTAARSIAKLEAWAEEAALDADTGRLYVRDTTEDEEEVPATGQRKTSKLRRKVKVRRPRP